MGDLISRSKIYNYIKQLINPYGKRFEGTSYELGIKLMEYIKQMEDAEYVTDTNVGGKWIPCSERLPTEKEAWDYNAEDDLYEPNEFIVQVKRAKLPTVAMFDGETFTHGYAEDGYGFMDEIIAWMPLPEPYKGE